LIKRIRWQIAIALLGIVFLGAMLARLAYTLTTVIVPDYGGTYVEGVAGNPSHINPILWQNDVDRDLISLIFNGLTDNNEKGEIIPDLASDWEVSDDGLVYTFHLRRDVRWHDGMPFTSDDVVFTIKTIQDLRYHGIPYLAELWRSVTVERVNDYTVRFTLQEPFTPFMDYTTLGLLPAHILRDVPVEALPESQFNLHPIGTGPFRVQEISTEHIVLEANPYFHGPKPYLSELEFRFYPDHESVFSAYERGEVDGISHVLPKDLPRVREDERLNLFSARLSGYSLIFLNLNRPVFKEKEVRQALLLAINRQGLIDRILEGQGLVAHSPIMPDSWAYNANIKRYEYDPEQAKALLDKAGWVDSDGDGVRDKEGVKLEFALLTNDDPVRVMMIEEISREWAMVGVKAEPQVSGIAGLRRDFLRPRRFDAVLCEWGNLPNDPDPYPMWHSTRTKDEGQNYAGFVHREADEILEEARRINDQAKRAELYRRFQEIFAEEVPSLLLYYPVYSYAVDEKVKGVQVGPMIDPSDRFRNIAQWYINTKRVIVSEAKGFDKSSK